MTGSENEPGAFPVVVVHRGFAGYLPWCLRKAAESHPEGDVVLLGDADNADLGIGRHCMADDESLQRDLAEFRGLYQHHSNSQPFGFERFCIERWFLIRNFLRREGIPGCLAIDSDVLLFCDVREEARRFRNYDMTFGWWDSVRRLPHCNFIRSREALESFCEYVLDVYRSQERLERIMEANRKKLGTHWVSDMSLFHDWSVRSGRPVASLGDTLSQGVGYDNTVHDIAEYLPFRCLPGLIRSWKKIEFEDGVPYASLRAGNRPIPMKCLHYNGRFKLLMERHAQGKPDGWRSGSAMLWQKLRELPAKGRLFRRNYIARFFGRRAR